MEMEGLALGDWSGGGGCSGWMSREADSLETEEVPSRKPLATTLGNAH